MEKHNGQGKQPTRIQQGAGEGVQEELRSRIHRSVIPIRELGSGKLIKELRSITSWQDCDLEGK